MASPVCVERWVCDTCQKEFDALEGAERCERGHAELRQQALWDGYFPRFHRWDTRYKLHCVECGVLLLEWACVFDGHRNEPGDRIINKKFVKSEGFGGARCPECFPTMRQRVLDALEFQKAHEKS